MSEDIQRLERRIEVLEKQAAEMSLLWGARETCAAAIEPFLGNLLATASIADDRCEMVLASLEQAVMRASGREQVPQELREACAEMMSRIRSGFDALRPLFR